MGNKYLGNKYQISLELEPGNLGVGGYQGLTQLTHFKLQVGHPLKALVKIGFNIRESKGKLIFTV